MSLITNTISVRGTSYTVREMDGGTMARVREILATEAWNMQNYLVRKCCMEPKFATEKEVAALSQFVINAIADEAFRLTKLAEEDAKND